MKNEKKNTDSNKFTFSTGRVIYLVQIVISCIATFAIIKLNLLPLKYLSIAILIIILSAVSTSKILISKQFTGKGFLKFVSVFISSLLVAATFYVFSSDSFISSITGANQDTNVISIIVRKDSEYNTFDDVKDLQFLANTIQDTDSIVKAKDLIKQKYDKDILVNSVQDYKSLIEEILSERCDVILLSEDHRVFVSEISEDFDESTKVIAEISFQENIEITDYNTNIKEDTFSIFLSGIDTYGPVSTKSRSDVNMVVTVNANTNQILLTSIPRDYHVILPKFGKYDKLTHAGIYGVGESVAAVEKLLNIEIDYYAKVNFSSVTQIVDALGGVNVYSQWKFSGRHGFNYEKGNNFVDGAKALSFVRERYSLPGGDNSRVINQQALVKGILDKAMSPSIISNYSTVLKSIDGAFEMSMSSDDFKTLIKKQADTMKSWDIIEIQLKGFGAHSTVTYSMPGWNLYVMEPDAESVKAASNLINQMENDEIISK